MICEREAFMTLISDHPTTAPPRSDAWSTASSRDSTRHLFDLGAHYACNLACVHCLSSSGRRDPNELSTEECKAVIDEFERMSDLLCEHRRR